MNERRFSKRLLALLLSALLICPLLPISGLLADARTKGEPHTAATTSTEKNELPNYQHYFGESTLNEHLYLVDEVLFTDNWYSHVERAYRDRNGVVTMIDPQPSQEVIDRCGNKPEVSVSGSQITITGGGQLRHADGDKVGRYFLILYAQDVDAINGCSKYVNVTIDTIGTVWENVGFEVYLVGFGQTLPDKDPKIDVVNNNAYYYEHRTKGLNNITIRGNRIDVFLVDCNYGCDKYGVGESISLNNGFYQEAGYRYRPYYSELASAWDHTYIGNSIIRMSGYDNHLIMDKTTNADENAVGVVNCRVCLNGNMPAYTAYKPETGELKYIEGAYQPGFCPGYYVDYLSSIELSNVSIAAMGSSEQFTPYYFWEEYNQSYYPDNGVLASDCAVTLNNCVWKPVSYAGGSKLYPLDKIVLDGFAQLELNDTQITYTRQESYIDYEWNPDTEEYEPVTVYYDVTEYVPIETYGKAVLTLDDTIDNPLTVRGRNTIRLNDTTLKNRIFIDNVCNANTERYLTETELERLAHGVEEDGAHLELQLAGSSTFDTTNLSDDAPSIMISGRATLTVIDDPAVAGIGELTVPASYYGTCAAIGGAPGLDPKPHGTIYVKSGVLTAGGENGAAAIGGSSQDPYVSYVILEESHRIPFTGDKAATVYNEQTGEYQYTLNYYYMNSSVGYVWYVEGDPVFDGPNGGYYLKEYPRDTCNRSTPASMTAWRNDSSVTLYAVDRNGNDVYTETVYELDGDGNKVIDEEASTPGYSRNGGVLFVSGGVVNATAKYGGAAIGGAFGGNGGGFIITAGTVNAEAKYTSWTGYAAAAIGGGAVNWGEPERTGIGYLSEHDWLNDSPANWDDGVYVDRYTYSQDMGGGSGHINIYGGVVNAVSDNPLYCGDYSPQQYEYVDTFYDKNGNSIYVGEDDLYYGYTDEAFVRSFGDGYHSGRRPGYVVGSACENANSYYENTTRILKVKDNTGGLLTSDSDALVILQQRGSFGYSTDNIEAAPQNYYRIPNPPGVMTHDALGRILDNGYDDCQFDPSLVSGAAIIMTIGWKDDRVYEMQYNEQYGCEMPVQVGGSAGYAVEHSMRSYATYRIRGQIDLPDLDYYDEGGEYSLILPTATFLHLLPGTVMNVGQKVGIMAVSTDQFVIENGATVKGNGRWPGKPPQPDVAPSSTSVRSLLRIMQQETGTQAEEVVCATYLAVVAVSDGQMVVADNSIESLKSFASGAGLNILNIFGAGTNLFKSETIGGVTTWKLNSRDATVSLCANGALTATPAQYTNYPFNVIVRDDNGGNVTVEMYSAKIHTPEYTVYNPHGTDDHLTNITIEDAGGDLCLTIALTNDQITNNDAVFSVPSFDGSEFSLRSFSALREKCAVRYGGVLSFKTPYADFANISITQLQLRYGVKLALDGIECDSSVSIPAIAGFPVSGGAQLQINTFPGSQLYALSVSLETPLFEGAFEASFKEAQGIVMLDTLYAELAVGEGGIPLVPPTVIGYIQGGGLGITGLADTVNMDSFGAPPVRLKIAAKGSVLDVIEGWIRLSVGLDGFDLTMTDIEIADLEIIKELGISAKWDAGDKMVLGKTYWGISADMTQYMVIEIPIPGTGEYEIPLISATGTLSYGVFAGYYSDDDTIYFLYQLHASGSLEGDITIPKKLVLSIFPFEDIHLANFQVGFYVEANLRSSVDKSKVQGSPSSVLNQLASNANLKFAAAVGAKVVAGAGPFKCYVRAVYVIGKKGIDISAGYGSGGDLNLSGSLNNVTGVKSKKCAVIAEIVNEQTGEVVPTVIEAGVETIALLDMTNNMRVKRSVGSLDTVMLTKVRGEAVTATVNQNVVGDSFLAITLNKSTTLTADQLTVKKDGAPVALTAQTYGPDGLPTNEGNFFADEGIAYFAPSAAGNYTIELNNGDDTLEILSIEVFRSKVFSTLDQDNTTFSVGGGTATAAYKSVDASTDAQYKVQLVLGKNEGEGDVLMAESDVLTGGTLYNGSLDFTLTGDALPTGDYYPTVLLLEYVEEEGENGASIATWTVIDQKSFAQVHYTNNVIPEAPQNVTLSYTGNSTMTAEWSPAEDADVYRLTVYEEAADGSYTDTGILYETTDASIIMDLSSLEAGRNYKIGVKALFYEDYEHKETSTYQCSCEGFSTAEELKVPVKPAIEYVGNITPGQGNVHTLTVSSAGQTFTISSETALNFSVIDAESGALIAEDAGVTALTVTVPAQTANKQLRLRVVALDPVTSDYALDYIDVVFDDVAPPLVLNELGAYTLHLTEGGFGANVTGRSEAGATIAVYEGTREYEWEDYTYKYVAGTVADDDGSFSILLRMTSRPEDDVYCVVALDKAGNRSETIGLSFTDAAVSVNLDPNQSGAVCTTGSVGLPIVRVGLDDQGNDVMGARVGILPEPFMSDGSMLFDGWFYKITTTVTAGFAMTAEQLAGLEASGAQPVVLQGDVYILTLNANKTYTLTNGSQTLDNGKYTVGDDDALTFESGNGATIIAQYLKPIVDDPEQSGEDPVSAYVITYKNEATVEVPVDAEDVLTEDITVYAHWVDSIIISYSEDDRTVAEIPVKKGRAIGTLPAPRIEKDGKVFVGWANSSDVLVDENTVFDENRMLFAVWADAVTVTFDAGLGSCETSELKVPVNGTINGFDDIVPESNGYDFEGWYYTVTVGTGDEAYTEEVEATANTTFGADTTLTAKWTRKTKELAVTQQSCGEGEELPDPVFDTEGMVGTPTITYVGTGDTVYRSNAKPTEAGSYRVLVEYNTYSETYVGSAAFTIGTVLIAGDVNKNGIINIQDVSVLLNILSDNSIPHDPLAADVDGNGQLGIGDVTRLLNLLATS